MEHLETNPSRLHALPIPIITSRAMPLSPLRNQLVLLQPACGFRWYVQIFLALALMCHSSNSDFNVIIPEICSGTETPINVTWVRDMVHLGLRDEQLALSIWGPEGMSFKFQEIRISP